MTDAATQGTGRSTDRRVRREARPDVLRWIALARTLAATLDALPRPLVIVEPGSPLRVWHANRAARDRLAHSELLAVRDGALVAAGDANAQALSTAVARALGAGPTQVHTALLTGPDLATKTLRLQGLEFGACADLPVARAVMIEVCEKLSPAEARRRLHEQFRLTPKEAECVLGLYAVGSVDGFARHSGKSVHTVRTQLKAAMQKTATNTQAALVARIADLTSG